MDDQIVQGLLFDQNQLIPENENNQKSLESQELTNSIYYQSFEKSDLQKLQNLQNYRNDNEKEEINQILIKVKVEIDQKTEEFLKKDKNINELQRCNEVLQCKIQQQEDQMQIIIKRANDTIQSYSQQYSQELDLKETFLDNLREQNSRLEEEVSSLQQGADKNLRTQLSSLQVKYNQSLTEIDKLNLDIINLQTQNQELCQILNQKIEEFQQFKNVIDLTNIYKVPLKQSIPMNVNGQNVQNYQGELLNQFVSNQLFLNLGVDNQRPNPNIDLQTKLNDYLDILQSNNQLGSSNEMEDNKITRIKSLGNIELNSRDREMREKQQIIINELENKVKQLQEALYTVLRENESLLSKLEQEQNNEKYQEVVQQSNDLKKQNDELKANLNQYSQNQVQNQQNIQQLEENEQEFSNLRQELESIKMNRDGLIFEIKLKSQELIQYSQQTEQDSLKIKELSQKNSQLINEIQILKNDLQSVNDLQNQNNQSQFDIEIIKQQYLLINTERQQLEEEMVVLQSQFQISQKENQKFVDQCKSSENEVKDLQNTVGELQKELDNSLVRIKNLTQGSNSKQYLERIENLNTEKQNLQSKVDELYNKIEEMNKSKSKDYFDNKEQLLQENSKLLSQIRDYQVIDVKQKATFDHAQKQLEFKDKKINSLENELELYKGNMGSSQTGKESTEISFAKLSDSLQKQSFVIDEKQDNNDLLLQLEHMIKENPPQSNNFQDLIFYQEKEQEYEQQLQVADQIIQRQNKEISELQVLLDQQRSEIQSLNLKYQELFEKIEKNQILYSKNISEKDSQNEQKDKQIQELQDQMKQLNDILKSYDDKDRTVFDLASTTRFELDKTRYDLNQLESALNNKTMSIQKLEEIIKQQEEQKYQSNASKDIEISDLQGQLRNKEYELEIIQSDIKQLQEEKKNLSSFLEHKYFQKQKELEQKIEELEKNNFKNKNKSIDSELLHLESQLQEQFNENQQLVHQFNQEQQKHNIELNDLNSEIHKKASKIKEIQDQLEQHKDKFNQLLQDLNKKNSLIEQQSQEIKKYSSEIQQIQFQLTQNQTEISRLQQEKNDVIQQLRTKEQEVKDFQGLENKIEQKLIQKYKKLNHDLNKEQEEIFNKIVNDHKLQIVQIQNEKDKQINDMQRYFKQEIDKNIKEQEEVIQSIIEQNLERDQRDKSEILNLKNLLAQKEKIIQGKPGEQRVLKANQGTPDHTNSQYQSDYQDKYSKGYSKEDKQKRTASKIEDQNSPVIEKEIVFQKNDNSFQVVNQSQYYQNQALDQMYSKCIQRSKNLLTKNEVLLNTLKQTHLSNQLGKQSPEKIPNQTYSIIQDNNQSQENILKFSKDYLLNQSSNGMNNSNNSRISQQQYNTTKEDSFYLKQSQDRINSQQSEKVNQTKQSQIQNIVQSYKQRSLSQHLGVQIIDIIKDQTPSKNEVLIQKVTHQTPLRYTQVKQQNSNSKKSSNYNFSPKYEGEKVGHLRQGRGRMWYNNGEVYEGEWKNDKRCGYGILRDTTGEIYNGDWDNDLYNGQGRLRNKNSEQFSCDFDFRNFDKLNSFWVSYSGEFRNHALHGLGTLVLSNGEKFLGSFQGGKIHGEGTFYRRNGEIQVGFWQNNKFIGNL